MDRGPLTASETTGLASARCAWVQSSRRPPSWLSWPGPAPPRPRPARPSTCARRGRAWPVTCRAQLTYGLGGLVNAVKVEVDWDTRNSPGGFQPDDQLACAPPLPEDLGYAGPCEAEQPGLRSAGDGAGRHPGDRHVDGTQATATQPLVVAAPRGAKGTIPASAARRRTCARRASPACSAAPATAARPPAAARRSRHNGWPAVTGILWKVLDSSGRKKVGGAANDELLGHHGSDRIFGGAGNDILWGDWDPANNNTHQKDLLDGGPGNDWLYPSHGATSSRPAPARTTSGPTTAAARSTAARARTPPESSSTGPGSSELRAGPALLRLRLRRPRRLPEARREAQGRRAASGRVGRGRAAR